MALHSFYAEFAHSLGSEVHRNPAPALCLSTLEPHDLDDHPRRPPAPIIIAVGALTVLIGWLGYVMAKRLRR